MKLEKLYGENAFARNLFALLSVLVVSGNFIDLCLSDSWISKGLFLFIFSFHMPLLIFLAGAIFKGIETETGKVLQLAVSSLGLYLLMKIVISIVRFPFSRKLSISLLSEGGAPWIFFSVSVYLLLACCVRRVDKRALLGLSFILAMLCGYSEAIGDFLVSSRTIVFSPFFILGWMSGIDRAERATNKKWFQLAGICVLALTLLVMVRFTEQCYFLRPLFTGRNAYTGLGASVFSGPLYRLLCYGVSAALVASVLAVTPRRSFGKYLDSIGASFVQIYFLYRPVLFILTDLGVYDLLHRTFGGKLGRIVWLACALACVVVLSENVLRRSLFYGNRLMQNKIIRTGVFVLVGFMILSVVSKIMTNSGDYRVRQLYGSFYEQEKNSLDAVYLGASTTYAYFQPLLAWERYGITVQTLSCPEQPLEAAEYLIKEARKTQPDALYIVPITSNNTSASFDAIDMHYLTDSMPLSRNKIQLVRTMGGYLGFDWSEQMEFLVPLIRFHSRWSELEIRDFENPLEGLKGAVHYTNFLRTSVDVTANYYITDRTAPVSEMTEAALESLLDYCDTEDISVVFIAVPRLRTDKTRIAQVNAIKETVQARGYPVLDMRSSVEEIGLDLTKDYYNTTHTNIHGAVKVTDYISRYLIENYRFEDKRGEQAYSSWDKAYTSYTSQYASAYTLDVEWEGEPRDVSLAAPELQAAVNGDTITVSWEPVPGADGYRIYRKASRGSSWKILDTAAADVLSYADSGCNPGTTYYYTVIACREEGDVYYWGDYNYAGVTAKALLNAPKLLSLAGSENDLTLTWEAVDGARGYAVFRKLPSKDWIKIADVGDATTFTDTGMLSDMPYQYTVKAYTGSGAMGSYDETGLLYSPELELPALEAAVDENGAIRLSWERIEGIQSYTVYRRTRDGDWQRLTADNLPEDSTRFRDVTAQAGIRYAYKLEAYIQAEDQECAYEMETGPEWVWTEKAAYNTAMPKIVYLEQAWNQVYAAWEAAADASSYGIYRRALKENGDWEEWTLVNPSVTETTCLDTPPAAGTYEYSVQALFEEDGFIYYGAFDAEGGTGVSFNIA